ncbi:MAG: MBL fold metallo-hydrolase [Clostridia bacterium]|nr:MBL fold metallo-hydrolase [Clostridia bacterium]
MKIEYFGHSCFKLTESTGTSIVCDPYDKTVGYDLPQLQSDAVTVSHGHFDHNYVKAVKGSPEVIDKEGSYTLPGVDIDAIKSYHDNVNGKARGGNLIFKFRMDGIDVCHLGDLGEECSSTLIDQLLPVNVLLIPVGGNYTIDAEMAKEYVDRIMPDVVIPMHFRRKGCKIDIDKVDEFVDLFDENCITEIEGGELDLMRSDLNGDTKVVILRRQ